MTQTSKRLNAAYFLTNFKFVLRDYYEQAESRYEIIYKLFQLNLIRNLVYYPKSYIKIPEEFHKKFAEIILKSTNIVKLNIKLNNETVAIYSGPIINSKILQELKLHFYVNKALKYNEIILKLLNANLRIVKFHLENDPSNNQKEKETQYFCDIFEELPQLYHLRKLQLSNLSLSGYEKHFYSILTELPNLNSLNLINVFYAKKNVETVVKAFSGSKFVKLKIKNDNNFLRKDIMLAEEQILLADYIYECKNLKTVSIFNNEQNSVKPETILNLLQNNNKLENIKFSYCTIIQDCAKFIGKQQNLKSLIFFECTLQTEFIDDFLKDYLNLLPNLTKLQFVYPAHNRDISYEMPFLKELSNALVDNNNLRYLAINWCNSLELHINEFSKGITKNCQIETFDFRGNALTCVNIDEFLTNISECKSLKNLIFDNNKISAAGSINIVEKLKNNENLKKISFLYNEYSVVDCLDYAKKLNAKFEIIVPEEFIIAKKRILEDAKDLNEHPIENFSFTMESFNEWKAYIVGPKGTPYEDGFFLLNISFTRNHPKSRPRIVFATKIYHSRIDFSNGTFEINIFNHWTSDIRMRTVINQIMELFYNQGDDDIYNHEAYNLYKVNKEEFNKKAKEWTKKYAS